MDHEIKCNLKEIALLVFQIRKLRFLSSAPPDKIKEILDEDDFFNKIETRLCNIEQFSADIQILLCELFLLVSRQWEGYMQTEDKPRFFLQRVNGLGNSISLFCFFWIRAFDNLSFEFLPIQKVTKLEKAQQNLLLNKKKISKILKKKISSEMIKEYFRQTTFLYYANIDLPFLGFSSLTRNVVYIAISSKLGDPFRKDIEAQLFEGFCYWLIKERRTPLTIISEELNIVSKQGFHIEPCDAYLERVYNAGILTQCPFRMFYLLIYLQILILLFLEFQKLQLKKFYQSKMFTFKTCKQFNNNLNRQNIEQMDKEFQKFQKYFDLVEKILLVTTNTYSN
ncbi:hypothetical protein pb186bvf_004396 [Paramecium bursaria]